MSGFRTLSAFLDDLERRGDLERVTREVDWKYEVTEIAWREAKREGPALLFENVRGAQFPLAVNVLAATRRIEWALGRTPRAIGAEIEEIFHALPPKAIGDLWALRGSAGRVLASRPKVVGAGASQQARAGSLDALPILQLWPKDGGRFVTFPLVFTQHPDTKKRNLGIYRMHVYDGHTTGMHWQIGKGGGFHYHRAEQMGAPRSSSACRSCSRSRPASRGCRSASRWRSCSTGSSRATCRWASRSSGTRWSSTARSRCSGRTRT
jgi:UbiD family decarboxylase